MASVNSYADKCMLDKFIASCRNDYVGDDGDADPLTAIQDICDTVAKIKQVYKLGNRTIEDHPETVFQKYLDAVVGLPDDATSWSIQLCSTYYGSLTEEVRNHMLKSKFKMPKVNGGFTTKGKQLQALRSVRASAVSAYESVFEEQTRLKKLMSEMNRANGGRERQFVFSYGHLRGTRATLSTSSIRISDSQAEQTIARCVILIRYTTLPYVLFR